MQVVTNILHQVVYIPHITDVDIVTYSLSWRQVSLVILTVRHNPVLKLVDELQTII